VLKKKKLPGSKRQTSGLFFHKNKLANPAKLGHTDAKFFADRFSYKKRINWSSYAKVMVVLRLTLK
jgi:hypothetical protein